jgi:hypothetical protein
VSHTGEFSSAMTLISSAHHLDVFSSALGLAHAQTLLVFGNQHYLMWLIHFFGRLRKVELRVRDEVVTQYLAWFVEHLRILELLCDSAVRIFQPLIHPLLCVACRTIARFLRIYVIDAITPSLYDFVLAALRFIIAIPAIEYLPATAIDAFRLHRTLKTVLRANGTAFVDAIPPGTLCSPAVALLLAELPVSTAWVIEALSGLLLSEDPAVFACAALLVRNHPNPAIGNLLTKLTAPEKRAGAPLSRVLMRLCLVLAVASDNPRFREEFRKSPPFPAFCEAFGDVVVHQSLAENWLQLEEAAVFFLQGLYRGWGSGDKPIRIELFFADADDMSPVAVQVLAEGAVAPFCIEEEHTLCLPWRQKFIFQYLLQNRS